MERGYARLCAIEPTAMTSSHPQTRPLNAYTVTATVHLRDENGGVRPDSRDYTVSVKAHTYDGARKAARVEIGMRMMDEGTYTAGDFILTFRSVKRVGDTRAFLRLSEASSYRGASMGRSTILPVNVHLRARFYLQRVRLDRGGYDSGGAYWGIGASLYRAVSAEGIAENDAHAELFVRAGNRHDAKAMVSGKVPGAVFYR
jgi:hypothetical protein